MALCSTLMIPPVPFPNMGVYFRKAAEILSWGDLSNAVVMDIGCGVGETSRKLLEVFPKIRQIIAFDKTEDMIETAKIVFTDLKINYCVADIENGESLQQWNGKISHAVSVSCFNTLRDMELALKNLYTILNDGGGAVIFMSLRGPYCDVLKDISQDQRWGSYIKNIETLVPESHLRNYGVDHYKDLLRRIGFRLAGYAELFMDTPSDLEGCKKHISEVFLQCAVVNLPTIYERKFTDEVFATLERHIPPIQNGRYDVRHHSLMLIMSKPVPELPISSTDQMREDIKRQKIE